MSEVPKNLKPHLFQKGISGNPSGKAKGRMVDKALRELLTANDGKKAKELAQVLIGRAMRGSVQAAKLIAERTEGKPKQQLDLEIGFSPADLLTDDQREERLRELKAKEGEDAVNT
jgi:uncharacterized protein DUF5681